MFLSSLISLAFSACRRSGPFGKRYFGERCPAARLLQYATKLTEAVSNCNVPGLKMPVLLSR